MRQLVAIGMVRRRRRPGDRTTYYRIEDDAWHAVVQRKLASLARFGAIAAAGIRLAGDDDRGARLRAAERSSQWLADIAAQHVPQDPALTEDPAPTEEHR